MMLDCLVKLKKSFNNMDVYIFSYIYIQDIDISFRQICITILVDMFTRNDLEQIDGSLFPGTVGTVQQRTFVTEDTRYLLVSL